MSDPKATPGDEIPVEDLERATGAGIPVTSQQTGGHQELEEQERRVTDKAPPREPDPWKKPPT